MTADRIDVLAVMDAIARDYDVLLPKQAPEVREARAAVAELIEVAKAIGPCSFCEGTENSDAWGRLDAALARIGAEQ